MSDTSITLLRLSANLAMFALKGKQGGMVQQQIETMELRQWLSLVSAWSIERAYSEVAALRDFGGGVPRMASTTAFIRSRARSGVRVWQKKVHEIEFNLLNRYLIVPVTLQFIFDRDGKHVPHRDTAKSS
jgi:hypothetical protein